MSNRAGTTSPPKAGDDTVSTKTWIAVIGANIGAFLAVLNIQVVNAALADIQGAIGAGIDDGGWISTAYLVTEIIVIPLTGWLARMFSVRVYLLVSTVFFLIFSVCCALTTNLNQMIVVRALQGFSGGALIPLAFTLVVTLLPKSKQPFGMSMYALSAMFAPAIGPTVGGYLNDYLGWHFIFYINLIPGLVMLPMLWIGLERKPMQLDLLKDADWIGIVTMAVGLGSLETVLEEGNKDDWFGSPMIVKLSIVAAIALATFLYVELTAKKPLLDLRLLKQRNFGLASLSNFLLGMMLYGVGFTLSLYLSQMQGYNAQQIGEVLAWGGLPQLVLIPLVPKLMQKIDARFVVAIGLGLCAVSNFLNIYITADVAGDQLLIPNVVRAVGLALVLAPLSSLAVGGLPPQSIGSASAIFNMQRNLGGAIGIAIIQTFQSDREKYHSNIVTDAVSPFAEATRAKIERLTQYFLTHGTSDPAIAQHKAIVTIGHGVSRQAAIMAYGDTFFLLGTILVLALIAALFLRKTTGSAAGAH